MVGQMKRICKYINTQVNISYSLGPMNDSLRWFESQSPSVTLIATLDTRVALLSGKKYAPRVHYARPLAKS